MPKNPYVIKRCAEIEGLLKYADAWAKKGDDKLAAHLAAYICVLFLGVLEDCIEHLISERASKSGDAEVRNFIVNSTKDHFRNPDRGAICGLLGEFSEKAAVYKEYKEKFSSKIKSNGPEADALEAITKNRHSLTHEGTDKLNLSVKDMEDYYWRVVPILDAMEEVLGLTADRLS